MMRTMTIGMAAMILAGGGAVHAQDAEGFTNHGVAADVSRHHGATAVVGADGQRYLLAWLHSFGDIAKIAVNIDTGETTQFEVEGPPSGCGGPFRSLRTSRNLWYSHFNGYFYEFDPERMEFIYVEALERGRCSMSAMEDEDGLVWMALFPTAELISYDPDTQELVNYGALNDEQWRQYPQRGLAMDSAGWVYTGIGNVAAQVVGYNTADGEVRSFIPEGERAHGSGRVHLGDDGNVYANAPEWGWHLLMAGEATAVEEPARDVQHHWGRASTSDGLPMLGFPDGSRVSQLAVEDRYLVVEEADETERRVEFDYVSGGSLVVGLVPGPDGEVWGVTGRPNYIFRFDPESEEMSSVALRSARWNAMTMHGETPFGGLYTGGWLASFDFARDVDPGQEPESNPRLHADGRPHINRPAALIAHPDGRHMVMGGTPGYGLTGGGLMIYDLEAEERTLLTHEDLLEYLSTCALVVLPDGNLVGATTVAAGTGGVVRAEQAELYIFDWEQREVVWRDAILPGRTSLHDMLLADDGLIYGIAHDSTLYVFDPEARELVHEQSLEEYGAPGGSQSPRMMIVGDDGQIYALFRGGIVRIAPGTFEHEMVAPTPVGVTCGIVLLDGRLYFGSGSRLWSYELPQ